MLEIEMKFPVKDFGPIRNQLQVWSTRVEESIEETDHYFNAPDRDFARTDEAFRLRRIGSQNRLTYKGPKSQGPAKTRTEIEVSLQEGKEVAEGMLSLVEKLGYRPTLVVQKTRTIHYFTRQGFELEACLDEVVGLGKYVEVEILTGTEQRDQAESLLLVVASELGLQGSEKRSYLEMLLAKKCENFEK